MSRLAREELRHFEQVRSIMERDGHRVSIASAASRYAAATCAMPFENSEPWTSCWTCCWSVPLSRRARASGFAKLVAPRLPQSALARFYAAACWHPRRGISSTTWQFCTNRVRRRRDAEVDARLARTQGSIEGSANRSEPDAQFRFSLRIAGGRLRHCATVTTIPGRPQVPAQHADPCVVPVSQYDAFGFAVAKIDRRAPSGRWV